MEHDPYFRLAKLERWQILLKCCRTLTIHQRIALSWRYERAWRVDAIASALNMTDSAASQLLRRARLSLKRELRRQGYELEDFLF